MSNPSRIQPGNKKGRYRRGVLVLPDQLAVRAANQAFTDTGTLADPNQNDRVQALAQTLSSTAQRLMG